MTIAVYAGTFDPLTEGHVSVVRQAVRLFAHVRVLVAVQPTKQPLFTAEERVAMIREALGEMPTVSVACRSARPGEDSIARWMWFSAGWSRPALSITRAMRRWASA